MDDLTKLNVYQRSQRVSEEVGGVKKTGKSGSGQPFPFHQIDHLYSLLRPAFIKYGLVLLPTLISQEIARHERNGKVQVECKTRIAVTFVNADSPEDRYTLEAEGMGFDFSDKAPGKGFTYALKTLLLAHFALRGQDDIESDDLEAGRGSRTERVNKNSPRVKPRTSDPVEDNPHTGDPVKRWGDKMQMLDVSQLPAVVKTITENVAHQHLTVAQATQIWALIVDRLIELLPEAESADDIEKVGDIITAQNTAGMVTDALLAQWGGLAYERREVILAGTVPAAAPY
jgi:hypothetical protein